MTKSTDKQKVSHAKRQSLRVGEVLVSEGVVTEKEIQNALKHQQRHKDKRLGELLVELGISDEASIARALADQLGLPYVDLAEQKIQSSALNEVSLEIISQHELFPIESDEFSITIAISDPLSAKTMTVLDNVESTCDKRVVEVVATPGQLKFCIQDALARHKNSAAKIEPEEKLSSDSKSFLHSVSQEADLSNLETNDSLVVKLVNRIVIDAINDRASDIHIEPHGERQEVIVRFRIDGQLHNYRSLPSEYRQSIVSRLKIMAQLNIAERRLPQDGKLRVKSGDDDIELRMVTIPTTGENEDVVLRILAASGALPLKEMGFSNGNLETIKSLVRRPYGLILAVGPTGSGKTTTLHSMLGEINEVNRKIWTVEDPVEITQPGLRQLQVHPQIGLTFASAMRSFLRADPDVIMVGELRDEETAHIGVEASLTGHMVFSTLHTNTAPETVTRLIDMGLDPFSFSDALLGILSQRLARQLCGKCKVKYDATPEERDELSGYIGADLVERAMSASALKLWRADGCVECEMTGYRGRLALHELLVNNDEIRTAIQKKSATGVIRDLAQQAGMKTLLQDGAVKCLQGHTDLRQVLAVCSR